MHDCMHVVESRKKYAKFCLFCLYLYSTKKSKTQMTNPCSDWSPEKRVKRFLVSLLVGLIWLIYHLFWSGWNHKKFCFHFSWKKNETHAWGKCCWVLYAFFIGNLCFFISCMLKFDLFTWLWFCDFFLWKETVNFKVSEYI